jgi:thiamine-phosphate pyrophosphorylase
MRGLYAIVDADFLDARNIPLLAFAERVVQARPAAVQLRAKHASAHQTLEWLDQLAQHCEQAGVPLFANDRPDLAVLGGCDGVHVGQEDLAISDVRRFAPALRIGVSTHDARQLDEALAGRPDYVAYGPVFPTSSKERPEPVVGTLGLARAAEACRAAGVPLVAIGGIGPGTASEVAGLASMGAVIRGLWPDDGLAGVARRAEELHRALGGR